MFRSFPNTDCTTGATPIARHRRASSACAPSPEDDRLDGARIDLLVCGSDRKPRGVSAAGFSHSCGPGVLAPSGPLRAVLSRGCLPSYSHGAQARSRGMGMPQRRVMVDGHCWEGYPGVHRFIDGNPPRLECLTRARRCERCMACSNIWITDDWRWRLLPRRWRQKILCVACYRAVVGEVGEGVSGR